MKRIHKHNYLICDLIILEKERAGWQTLVFQNWSASSTKMVKNVWEDVQLVIQSLCSLLSWKRDVPSNYVSEFSS